MKCKKRKRPFAKKRKKNENVDDERGGISNHITSLFFTNHSLLVLINTPHV